MRSARASRPPGRPDRRLGSKTWSGLKPGGDNHRWQVGQAPRIEDFLGEPEGPEREVLLRELLRVELDCRRQQGSVPAVEDYLSRFPGHEPLIRAEVEGRAARAAGVPRLSPDVGTGAERDALKTTPHVVGPNTEPEVPEYEVLGELGRGGMGIVYLARQTSLNRTIALKVLLHADYATPEEQARFLREAEALARLRHDNVVQVHEAGVHGGAPFFAMEHVAGGSLADYLRGTPVAPVEAARLAEALARGVQAAHEAGIVHRDLKPANVLLEGTGPLADAGREVVAREQAGGVIVLEGTGPLADAGRGGETRPPLSGFRAKVSDFGLARWADQPGQTASGAVLGTPSYMAP